MWLWWFKGLHCIGINMLVVLSTIWACQWKKQLLTFSQRTLKSAFAPKNCSICSSFHGFYRDNSKSFACLNSSICKVRNHYFVSAIKEDNTLEMFSKFQINVMETEPVILQQSVHTFGYMPPIYTFVMNYSLFLLPESGWTAFLCCICSASRKNWETDDDRSLWKHKQTL